MASNETQTPNKTSADDDVIRIDPPAKKRRPLAEPIKLIFQLLHLGIIVLPIVLWSIIRNVFFTRRKNVEGKVVLVTGSGRGLGRGFVEKFAELGCKVACADIDEELNRETVNDVNKNHANCAKAYTYNVALSEDVINLRESVEKDFGRVDIVIHNAGLIASAPLNDFDDLYLHGIIHVNLTSHFIMIREFLPRMLERNDGHIVAIGSIACFSGMAKASMYVAAKHGVYGLMDCLHHEVNTDRPNNRIKTSIVCPYFVNTSALYTRFWKIRVPELSIRQTVEAAVDGILKDKRVITIPSHLYFVMMILKLLPDKISQIFLKIFYIKIHFPPKSYQQKTTLYRLLAATYHKYLLSTTKLLEDSFLNTSNELGSN